MKDPDFEKLRPGQRLGDAPITEEYRERMKATAEGLDKVFNGDLRGKDKKTGFVLMVFPYGETASGRCNYISNGADRRDIVTLMKEMIARFEGQPGMKGNP